MIYNLEHRVKMCQSVGEGCELQDSIDSLCHVARELEGGDDESEANHILISAEAISRRYLEWALDNYEVTYEEYLKKKEVFTHFLGKEYAEDYFESDEEGWQGSGV